MVEERTLPPEIEHLKAPPSYSRDSNGRLICAGCTHDEFDHMIGPYRTGCCHCGCKWFVVDFREIRSAVDAQREKDASGMLNDYVNKCHENAVSKGFWDDCDITDVYFNLSKLMLIVTEVAEAAEAIRHDDKVNFAEELADICIRVFDFAVAHGIDLEREIINKMKKNRARPYMHGKRA
jgi:NTP pyrophosphatase (non-canonical NTP hydrolase)